MMVHYPYSPEGQIHQLSDERFFLFLVFLLLLVFDSNDFFFVFWEYRFLRLIVFELRKLPVIIF